MALKILDFIFNTQKMTYWWGNSGIVRRGKPSTSWMMSRVLCDAKVGLLQYFRGIVEI